MGICSLDWFALANFGKTFNWIHYANAYRAADIETRAIAASSFYNLTETALTFFAGVILIATAHMLARKLTKLSEKSGG